ncbi:MAG: Tat pathway signal protein [Verrucomicrobia bacterium]|nr:Tat pathway signal protein [Verrucomicrobiota bacterium]
MQPAQPGALPSFKPLPGNRPDAPHLDARRRDGSTRRGEGRRASIGLGAASAFGLAASLALAAVPGLGADSGQAPRLDVGVAASGDAGAPRSVSASPGADPDVGAAWWAPVARAGDASVTLHWAAPSLDALKGYEVHRGTELDGPFHRITPGPLGQRHFADLTVTNGVTYYYVVRAIGFPEVTLAAPAISATPRPFSSDAEFLELLQATAFDYFWFEANPANGLVRDRSTPDSFCSIAAVGFGLTAIGIGIDHGWISRIAGRDRTRATLETFWEQPQGPESSGAIGYRGWFYHFLDLDRATRFQQVELSSIDTGLLLAGVIFAREYFAATDPVEGEIRALANALLARVDWGWMLAGGSLLSMGWHPERGFIEHRWIGYNEAMILYVLGLGASRDPLPATCWEAWTRGYRWETHYGQSFVVFPPLFGHQYSHCWIDFRGRTDAFLRARGIDYFENSRRATLAQRAYAIANPRGHPGYGPWVWGLTACDGPGLPSTLGYRARGAPPPENDDGTLAPTAVGGSLPFAPEVCLPTLRHLYDQYRAQLWTAYGFRDAFNLRVGWWDPDVLGIDQGPMLLMAENHRTGRVWRRFMQAPEVQRGLARAGFGPTD